MHYSFNFYGIPTLIISFAILSLSLIVLMREKGSPIGFSFFFSGVCMFIWFFSFTWMYWTDDSSLAKWWAKLAYLGVPFIPSAIYTFSSLILHAYESRKWLIWVFWLISIIFSISSLTTDAFIKSVFHYTWGFYPLYGWLGVPFLVFFFALVMLCLYDFWKQYHAATSGFVKNRMRLLFSAFSIACLASVDYLPKYGIAIYPFGYLAIFAFVIIISYMLIRYRFVDLTPSFAANQIISTMGDALIVCDMENRILVVNDAVQTLFGYKKNSIIGKNITIFFEESKEKKHQFASFLNREKIYDKEFEFLTNKLDPISVSLTISQIIDDFDNRIGSVIIARDIRERKKLESEARSIQLIFDVTNSVISSSKLEEMLQCCLNLVCIEMDFPIGHIYFPDKEQKSLSPSQLIYYESQEEKDLFYEEIMKTSYNYGEYFVGMVWSSKKPLWITDIVEDDILHYSKNIRSVMGFPVLVNKQVMAVMEFCTHDIRTPNKDLMLTLKVLSDQVGHLIERHYIQEQVQQLEERNRLILLSAGEGIYGLDKDDKAMFVNPAAANMLGYQTEELLGKPMHSLVHHSYADKSPYPHDKCPIYFSRMQGKTSHVTDEVLWRKDGSSFPVEYTVTPITKAHKILGSVVIFTDITQRKAAEKQLAEQSQELQAINERILASNQELEQFAYVTSHDLKAPLRAIDNLVSWIEEENMQLLSGKSKEYLELLRKRTNRMYELIEGILQYSRASRIHMETSLVDVKQLVKEVVDTLNPSKSFTVYIADNLPVLQAPRIPLFQVFSNLISNAIRHHNRNDGRIEITVRDMAEFYEFSVADDGPGIEPQYHDKIFQIFQTLQSRDVFESTGIGLSIVKKIVESQHGTVTIDSERGKGSTFRFTWPKT